MSGRRRASTPDEVRHLAALLDDLDLVAAHVERPAGKRFRQHEAEAVDVRLRRHVAAEEAELLGRHVVVLAGEAAADHRAVAEHGRAGDAEVDDLGARDVAGGQDDVVGRDVAVDDAEVVRGLQAAGETALQDADGIVVERALLQDVGERLPVDELHREVGRADVGVDREHVVADDRLVVEVVERRRFLAGTAPARRRSVRARGGSS